jgi:hypothetical protein
MFTDTISACQVGDFGWWGYLEFMFTASDVERRGELKNAHLSIEQFSLGKRDL